MMLLMIYLRLYILYVLLSGEIMVMLNVDPDVINKSYKAALKARNYMFHFRKGKFYPNVCCLCHQFITLIKKNQFPLSMTCIIVMKSPIFGKINLIEHI